MTVALWKAFGDITKNTPESEQKRKILQKGNIVGQRVTCQFSQRCISVSHKQNYDEIARY